MTAKLGLILSLECYLALDARQLTECTYPPCSRSSRSSSLFAAKCGKWSGNGPTRVHGAGSIRKVTNRAAGA